MQSYPAIQFYPDTAPPAGYLQGWPPYALAILNSRGYSKAAIAALKMEKFHGNSYYDCLAALEAKLTLNDIAIDKSQIWDFAVEFWKRQRGILWINRQPGYAQAVARHQVTRCSWVTEFWRLWNLGLCGTVADLAAVNHIRACVNLANTLINHPQYGNPEWAANWTSLLSLYNPTRVNSVETARIFSWLIHNGTRKGQHPRKLSDISLEWGWPAMSTNRLVELVKHCGGNPNANLDPTLAS